MTATQPIRISRSLEMVRDGSRIYTVHEGEDAGPMLGRYTEGRGFVPTPARADLGPVNAPPGGSARSQWIAVRRGIRERIRAG